MKFLSFLFTCFMIPFCAQSLVASEQTSLQARMKLYLNRAANNHYYVLSATKSGELCFLNRSIPGNNYVTSNEVFAWKAQQRAITFLNLAIACDDEKPNDEKNIENGDDLDITSHKKPSPRKAREKIRKELVEEAHNNQTWQHEHNEERK